MRRISTYDAKHCENAENNNCRCRCKGVLHGLTHSTLRQYEDSVVEAGEELTQLKVTRFANKEAKRLKNA